MKNVDTALLVFVLLATVFGCTRSTPTQKGESTEPTNDPLAALHNHEILDEKGRKALRERIVSSDLNEDSKQLFSHLVLQNEAWNSGLIENLGLPSIQGAKHDPALVRRVFLSLELTDASNAKFQVFLADRSGLHRKSVRSTYIVADQAYQLQAWQITRIDGDMVLGTELMQKSFPAVLKLREGSRHNGDVGHFEFRLTKQSIEGINNAFGGKAPLPPYSVLIKRAEALTSRGKDIVTELRQSMRREGLDAERACAEFTDDLRRRRAEFEDFEKRLHEMASDPEDVRFGLHELLVTHEEQIDALASAQTDADQGEFEGLLQQAVSRSLPGAVEAILAAEVKVDALGADGYTPLQWAILRLPDKPTKTRIAELLLEKGADPNAAIATQHVRGGFKQSLLMNSLNSRHPPIVRLLLDYGAEVNATDKLGRNALHLLCYMPHFPESLPVAKMLIDAGSDVNNTASDGQTVMHAVILSASSYDHLDRSVGVIELLLDQKPDLSKRDKRGYRALQADRKHPVPDEFRTVLKRLESHEVARPWIVAE